MILKAAIARKALVSILTVLALATAATNSFSQSASSLESMMGTESYRAAGLNKLSESEQAELVRWLQSRGIHTDRASRDAAAVKGADDEAGKADEAEQAAAERVVKATSEDEFESRLKQPFRGWSGKTMFELKNGQVWRQRLPGRYLHREDDLPRVRITRNLMGYYEMELLDYGRKIGVSRVR